MGNQKSPGAQTLAEYLPLSFPSLLSVRRLTRLSYALNHDAEKKNTVLSVSSQRGCSSLFEARRASAKKTHKLVGCIRRHAECHIPGSVFREPCCIAQVPFGSVATCMSAMSIGSDEPTEFSQSEASSSISSTTSRPSSITTGFSLWYSTSS